MMKRTRMALGVDELEVRSLLSGISYTLTTDQSAYQVGQPIEITFTETNTGDQPVAISLSPTDFSVSLYGGVIWESNPQNDGRSPTSVTLEPEQSVSQTATWDGTIMEQAYQQGTSMSYAVNQLGTFQVSNPNAPSEDTATFQINDPLQGALTTDQTTYQIAQPVQLTYTETNTSGQTLTIATANPLYQIMHNGQPVLPVEDPLGPTFETITPGQTITNQYVYRPPGFDPYTLETLTGLFVAEVYDVPAAPGKFTADFQIAAPPVGAIVSSVTTDQPIYHTGQTVAMTLTETNESDQPVMVVTGQNGFVFDQPWLTPNLNLDDLPELNPAGWSTLEPGQSWTQTETWRVGDAVSGPYTLEISNVYDLNGNTATFEVSGASSSDSTSTSATGGGGSSSMGRIAPLINSTLTTNHADYKIGERIHISLKIPGTDAGRPASSLVQSREQITVLDGTQVVYRMTRRVPASALKHLKAGRSVTLNAVWKGRPNGPGIHGLEPGPYTIDVAYGDYGGSTSITMSNDSNPGRTRRG